MTPVSRRLLLAAGCGAAVARPALAQGIDIGRAATFIQATGQ